MHLKKKLDIGEFLYGHCNSKDRRKNQYFGFTISRKVKTQLKCRNRFVQCKEKVLWLVLQVKSGLWSFMLEISHWRMLCGQADQLKRIAIKWRWHPNPVLLPGKSHGWRSLEGCSPCGCWGLDTTERLHFHFSLSCIGEGNGNPLQCSCLENPRDGGAWWAAVSVVAQSWTRLKRLSSSMFIPCKKQLTYSEYPSQPNENQLGYVSCFDVWVPNKLSRKTQKTSWLYFHMWFST